MSSDRLLQPSPSGARVSRLPPATTAAAEAPSIPSCEYCRGHGQPSSEYRCDMAVNGNRQQHAQSNKKGTVLMFCVGIDTTLGMRQCDIPKWSTKELSWGS